ncbi:hypothetical protein POM88_026930 [Heracleum sosnowskyi]|uniref:Uncharacterized protein n=1 Tax=Heracleum sosnowskyi TaxID=360622 RepID=A0AAD8I809_9APIA|nr:hypothetical protein POM88_026930 [Heracleum sosnowskyi]
MRSGTLEKLGIIKVVAGDSCAIEESGIKQLIIFKPTLGRVWEDSDYKDKKELMSEGEPEGNTKKLGKMSLILRQETKEKEVDECTVQFYSKTDGILEDLKVGVEARRFLYIYIYDALKECKSSPQDSFNFLIKYLATISDGDVTAMEKAKLNVVRAVFEVIRHPCHFNCTFHEYHVVVQLMEDDKYKMIYELLKIFRTQEYETYMVFYIENSLTLNELGIPHEECVEKMRLITLMEMCDADLEYSFENEVSEIENGRKNEDDIYEMLRDQITFMNNKTKLNIQWLSKLYQKSPMVIWRRVVD